MGKAVPHDKKPGAGATKGPSRLKNLPYHFALSKPLKSPEPEQPGASGRFRAGPAAGDFPAVNRASSRRKP
jgi:hypothetical protein